MSQIENGITIDPLIEVGASHNQVCRAIAVGDIQAQNDAISSLADLLATNPKALEALLNLQK